jgi:sortase A
VAAARRALGRIEIPRLGISGMIAEGTDNATLKRAVGHVRSTSQPGEAGNVGLAAHRDGFFRGLGGVRKDDLIRIVTPRGTFSYRVEWSVVVDPHRIDVLDATAERSLTLITCYPFNWIGHAPKRFVVRAKQFAS